MRGTDKQTSILEMVDRISLRFSSILHDVDWDYIIDQTLPYTNNHRKNTIRHASGKYSINPVLLLSKLVQDQKEISHIFQSDEEFMSFTNSFANELSRCEHKFDAISSEGSMTLLEYSLRNALNNDDALIHDFVGICESILQKHDILEKTGISKPVDQRDVFKRNQDDTIELELPYSATECWQLSASHFGALEIEGVSETNGKLSSIDFSPSLYQRWYVPFDYLFSSGEVFSSHDGKFYKHSDCSVEITHEASKFSTYYSHLQLNNITDGTYIEQGHHLGNISLDPDNSNCKCNYAKKEFSCATGPHMHFELRYDGKPESLDGKIISNLRIRTGTNPHDLFCSDPRGRCDLATGKQGESCATTYTDVNTGKVTCPVTKGSNIGTKTCSVCKKGYLIMNVNLTIMK